MIDNMEWFNYNLENEIPFGFARFNDGEMIGISQAHTMVARGDQYVDETLRAALRSALEHKQENYQKLVKTHYSQHFMKQWIIFVQQLDFMIINHQ